MIRTDRDVLLYEGNLVFLGSIVILIVHSLRHSLPFFLPSAALTHHSFP